GADRELDGDAASEVRVAHEALVVAVANLVDVVANDATDDVLVHRAADRGLGDPHLRRTLASPLEAGASAASVRVALAGPARASSLADPPHATEPDGALATASTAAARAHQSQPAGPERLAHLVSGEASPHVGVVVADRERIPVGR